MAVQIENLNTSNNKIDVPAHFHPALYKRLWSARNIVSFRQTILQEVTTLGFTDFAIVTFAKQDVSLQELSSLPADFVQAYYGRDLYKYDEIRRYVQLNIAPITMSRLVNYAILAPYETESTRAMQKIYELSKSFGYFDFYHTPIKSCSNNLPVMLSVALVNASSSDLMKNVRGSELSLRSLAETIDYVGVKNFPEFFGPPKKSHEGLTARALNVLEEFANSDLSINEVASKLCISAVTAHQHIAAARRALNVKNNQAAIKYCVLEGLIKLRRL